MITFEAFKTAVADYDYASGPIKVERQMRAGQMVAKYLGLFAQLYNAFCSRTYHELLAYNKLELLKNEPDPQFLVLLPSKWGALPSSTLGSVSEFWAGLVGGVDLPITNTGNFDQDMLSMGVALATILSVRNVNL